MAEKDELDEIKKIIKTKRMVIGTETTLKNLKIGKLEKVWLSSNIPADLKEDITSYSKMNDVEVISLSIPNDELGVQCKKQFPVSVVSLLKGEN